MDGATGIKWGSAATLLLVALISFGLWGCPKYRIYRLDANGRAALAEAKWTKQVQIEQAKSQLEAMEFKQQTITKAAEAEAVRKEMTARADSLATAIMAGSLEGERGQRFLQYLWIDKTSAGVQREVIYVPGTGLTLPITEAGRASPR